MRCEGKKNGETRHKKEKTWRSDTRQKKWGDETGD